MSELCSLNRRFQDIETAVVEEIGRQELNLGQDQGLSQQKGVVADVELRVGLSADEFVRVCLKLMRDNFLVAVSEMTFFYGSNEPNQWCRQPLLVAVSHLKKNLNACKPLTF